MGFRFTRKNRLARKSEIDAVYRKGRRISARFLRLHLLATGRPDSRLAISVPRRLGDAVQRNRWRRLVREAFRLHPDEIGAGWDILAVPLRPVGQTKRPEVDAALLEVFGRLR